MQTISACKNIHYLLRRLMCCYQNNISIETVISAVALNICLSRQEIDSVPQSQPAPGDPSGGRRRGANGTCHSSIIPASNSAWRHQSPRPRFGMAPPSLPHEVKHSARLFTPSARAGWHLALASTVVCILYPHRMGADLHLVLDQERALKVL